MTTTLIIHSTEHLEMDWTGNVWLRLEPEPDAPDPWWRRAAFWIVRLAFGGRTARAIADSGEGPRRSVLLGNADGPLPWPGFWFPEPAWYEAERDECVAAMREADSHRDYRRQVRADYSWGLGDVGRPER